VTVTSLQVAAWAQRPRLSTHRDLNTVTVTYDTSVLSQARPHHGQGLAAWVTVAGRGTLADPRLGSRRPAAAARSLRGHAGSRVHAAGAGRPGRRARWQNG
jgi:hypothetical protein